MWLILLLAAATLAPNAGQLGGSDIRADAVGRNVIAYAALAILVGRINVQIAWVPLLTYTISCMLFGVSSSGSHIYWWAFVLQRETSAQQTAMVAVLAAVAFVSYVLRPSHGSQDRGRARPEARSVGP